MNLCGRMQSPFGCMPRSSIAWPNDNYLKKVSVVVVLVYNSTRSAKELLFPYIFGSICCH